MYSLNLSIVCTDVARPPYEKVTILYLQETHGPVEESAMAQSWT